MPRWKAWFARSALLVPLVPPLTCVTATDGSYHVTQPAAAAR